MSRGQARDIERVSTVEAAVERDSTAGDIRLGDGRVADRSRRILVMVYDTDGSLLRDIPVPFGINDLSGPAGVVRFGVSMLDKHHPDLRVLETREHTATTEAAILVADRGPL